MRKLFFYTKQQFFNFKAMQTAAGFKLLSMSQLLSNQKVGELNKNQKYYVDLSSVMGYTKTNDSQQMLFEQLFDSFGENIDFICDKMYEEDIKYIFRYIFDDFSDVDAASEEIIAEKETIIETPSRKRRIVDLNDKELDDFFKVFDASLYGHERFKEEFKKLVTAYRVFNKIGEHKILSLFLMGDSGVGKTEVARAIHKALGSRTKLAKVNFGNYSSHDALNSLIGSPLGYIGSDGGELLKRIQESDVGLILIDEFEKAGIRAFGPRKNAAILEGSKAFSKDLMKKYDIPTAAYENFDDPEKALEYLRTEAKFPIVLKADGLALGKGVLICQDLAEAEAGVKEIMEDKKFGKDRKSVV